MTSAQMAVAEFHQKFGQPIGLRPRFTDRRQLRAALIQEEAGETIAAILAGDMVETADGLCDLIYVVLGAAVEFGIDLEPLFKEVHASNLAKVGGATRPDGKVLKPEGWTKPRIAELLREQGWSE